MTAALAVLAALVVVAVAQCHVRVFATAVDMIVLADVILLATDAVQAVL